MLRFDPETGLFADSTEDVRTQVRDQWRAALGPELDVDASTPAGQLIDSQTAAITAKDSDMLYMASQFNPATAEGLWQDALANIYFLRRKIAQPSVAHCRCTGLAGTVIAAGSVIKSALDGTLWTATRQEIIGVTGTVIVPFASQRRDGLRAAPDTLTRIVTVTPGWDTVTNADAAMPGRIEEERGEFEKRRAESVAKNAHGSLPAIYSNLADLEGVISCITLENITNQPQTQYGVSIDGHSIYAAVVGGDDTAIAKVLYQKKDAGCGTTGNTKVTYQDTALTGKPIYTYHITRPQPVSIGVAVSIKIGSSVTTTGAASIVAAIKAAIANNFLGQDGSIPVGMAQNLYASRFYTAIHAVGAGQLVNVKICSPAGAGLWTDIITINADQYPVISDADIGVYINDAIPDSAVPAEPVSAAKVFWLHGLNSSSVDTTSINIDNALHTTMQKMEYNPWWAWDKNFDLLLRQAAEAKDTDLFIGVSMGGYWAAQLATHYGAKFITINGAVDMAADIYQLLGTMTDGYGVNYVLTKDIVDTYGPYVTSPPFANAAQKMAMAGRGALALSLDDGLLSPQLRLDFWASPAGYNMIASMDTTLHGHDPNSTTDTAKIATLARRMGFYFGG